MSFRYRFATLLELRRKERDEAGAAVGKVNEAIDRVRSQIEEVEQNRHSLQGDSTRQRNGSVSVDRLLTRGRYALQLDAEIATMQQTLAKLDQEHQRRQAALVEAEAEVKRFERLRDNEKAAYDFERLRREQAEADDQTSQRYALAMRAANHAARTADATNTDQTGTYQ